MAKKMIQSELELKKWFIKNYRDLGYSKIVRGDKGKFPDFIMSETLKTAPFKVRSFPSIQKISESEKSPHQTPSFRTEWAIFQEIFLMLKNNKETRVELETISSNFILHNHSPEKVDEVVCIIKNVNLNKLSNAIAEHLNGCE